MVLNASLSGDIVLRPEDDLMHPVGPESNFNESVYLNFYDADARLGGWMRLGNRPNEGYAERTVCLYLPDGEVAFGFERAPISDNESFDAGGLTIETVRPFELLKVRFDGALSLLPDGMAMADPKAAFTQSPEVPVAIDLEQRGISDMYGGEPLGRHEAPGEEVAQGHTEQLMAVTGSVSIGDRHWTVAAHGLRDHSWGPRYWQNVDHHRWMTGNFGDQLGFMAVLHVTPSGVMSQRGGFVWEDGAIHLCDELAITSTYRSDAQVHDTIDLELTSGARSWKISGRVLSLVPCRNRRGGQTTRISEGMTEWRSGDRVGHGLSEYLDQIGPEGPSGVLAGH